MLESALPEVFTADEVATAAGIPLSMIDAMVAGGDLRLIPGTRFVAWAEAVRAGRELRIKAQSPDPKTQIPTKSQAVVGVWDLGFGHWGLSLAAHAAVLIAAVWFAAARAETAAAPIDEVEPARLVFIVSPGTGGGGGGGGVRVRAPEPPRAQPPGNPLAPPPPDVAPAPPDPAVVAPVATMPETPAVPEAANPATGPGAGEGSGSGIGEGSGGGTGGGPYRPGSGIEPPRLLREVKADYTAEARRANVRGDVVLEIVVRSDGTVGDVTVLQGLGSGLDQRAIAAVRQWRFSPARRLGAPVDVIVEVAIEFSLR